MDAGQLRALVRKPKFLAVGAFALIAVFALFVNSGQAVSALYALGGYPEVEELAHGTFTFQEYQEYFRQLAERKGALYAFEVLKQAPFPPGVDLHLLGHTLGDTLYAQKGIDAIGLCTDDFRNACSHSVVIAILTEHGEGSLPEIAEVCAKAPGGKGAYLMCFHGLGHGVLAYNAYDLRSAVAMCGKAGVAGSRGRESVECVGGTIMEMIGGVHDRAMWERQKAHYFKDSDPLYPCDSDFIPLQAKPICYTYLTPHLFMAAGADLGRPDPATFPEAFSYCDALPASARAERDACYGGFGKEFVVLAEGRDIRNIGQADENALRLVREWCALAGSENGKASCDRAALSSLFWGGENPADAALSYCALGQNGDQAVCYRELANQMAYYLDGLTLSRTCKKLPEEYRSRCER